MTNHLVAHVSDALRPFCRRLIISCNQNQAIYGRYAALTVTDGFGEFEGPFRAY